MRHRSFAVVLACLPSLTAQQAAVDLHVPPRGAWQRRSPADVGMDAAALAELATWAMANETRAPRDGRAFQQQSFGKEPHHEPVGPLFDRGGVCGLVVRNGYIVAEWGDVARADMCNSITKTFLTTVTGLAWQRGLIRDVHDRVGAYMPAGVNLFTSEHNRSITWDHLLRQTSDWQGTLWGKPDWADRPEGKTPADWPNVPRQQPGARFEYNDVRVNVLALAALHVWRRPLPQVLRDELMDPIGTSSAWRWHGYDDAWLELDGVRMQSVSGGGHWGGGMVLDAFDLARFGLLFARDGRWGERQLVQPEWIAMARAPGTDNREYGHANWFLNTGREALPDAPESAVRFVGNGTNLVYVDREHDLVAVVRWIAGSAVPEFVRRLHGSLTPPPAAK